jgi:excisionase family DNA binding protein
VGGEPRTAPQEPPLITIDEAATYLNVPARWVADAVRQRKVRCTRIGKHVRFRVEHLDELVAAGEQPVTSDVIRDPTQPHPIEAVNGHGVDIGRMVPPVSAVSMIREINSSPAGNR